jgi:proteasome assembly chaperone (PAC2) family protein
MSNIVDSHQSNAGEYAHDAKQLPEVDHAEQLKATNIYTMGAVQINTVLDEDIAGHG